MSAFPELHFGYLAQWQVQGWKYKIKFHINRKVYENTMLFQGLTAKLMTKTMYKLIMTLTLVINYVLTEKKSLETFRWFILNNYLPKISTALFTTAARWNIDDQSMFFLFPPILFKYQLNTMILLFEMPLGNIHIAYILAIWAPNIGHRWSFILRVPMRKSIFHFQNQN